MLAPYRKGAPSHPTSPHRTAEEWNAGHALGEDLNEPRRLRPDERDPGQARPSIRSGSNGSNIWQLSTDGSKQEEGPWPKFEGRAGRRAIAKPGGVRK